MLTDDTKAAEHHVRIQANVADYLAGRIALAAFRKRASSLHAAARADGPGIEDALRERIRQTTLARCKLVDLDPQREDTDAYVARVMRERGAQRRRYA